MAKIKLLAGDFGTGAGTLGSRAITLPRPDLGVFKTEEVHFPMLQSVDVATEENVKRAGGTVGWGLAGAALLGPVGLLAGLLVGGRGKDVTFVAVLKDGRRLMATTDASTYKKIVAATF